MVFCAVASFIFVVLDSKVGVEDKLRQYQILSKIQLLFVFLALISLLFLDYTKIITFSKSQVYVKVSMLVIYIIFLLISHTNFDKEIKLEHLVITMFLLLGSFTLISSKNLATVLVSFEVLNICYFILAHVKNYMLLSIESCCKYFFLASISSSFFCSGVLLFNFVVGGTLKNNSVALMLYYNDSYYFVVGVALIFLFVAIVIKLGLFLYIK